MGVRRVERADLRAIAKATGATVLLNLANLDGALVFLRLPHEARRGELRCECAWRSGECCARVCWRAGDHCNSRYAFVPARESPHSYQGTKTQTSSTILLRGANHLVLDEMERAIHDALCAVKRVLESRKVVPGGGAVEAALAIHLEKFAESLVRPKSYLSAHAES